MLQFNYRFQGFLREIHSFTFTKCQFAQLRGLALFCFRFPPALPVEHIIFHRGQHRRKEHHHVQRNHHQRCRIQRVRQQPCRAVLRQGGLRALPLRQEGLRLPGGGQLPLGQHDRQGLRPHGGPHPEDAAQGGFLHQPHGPPGRGHLAGQDHRRESQRNGSHSGRHRVRILSAQEQGRAQARTGRRFSWPGGTAGRLHRLRALRRAVLLRRPVKEAADN